MRFIKTSTTATVTFDDYLISSKPTSMRKNRGSGFRLFWNKHTYTCGHNSNRSGTTEKKINKMRAHTQIKKKKCLQKSIDALYDGNGSISGCTIQFVAWTMMMTPATKKKYKSENEFDRIFLTQFNIKCLRLIVTSIEFDDESLYLPTNNIRVMMHLKKKNPIITTIYKLHNKLRTKFLRLQIKKNIGCTWCVKNEWVNSRCLCTIPMIQSLLVSKSNFPWSRMQCKQHV